MFIEQFWLRRDPTPGTLENEYREEHYRRIAYANDRFGTDNVAGWKTDRGMIYIKFGPPDEKELHPDAAPPRDVWLYRFIQGIGQNVKIEFVDESRTGEYRMTRDPAAAPAATVPSPPAQALPGGGGRGGRDVALAQFLDGDAAISVRPRSGGTVTAVHVTERQFVRAGQPLVDLDSNNPPYDHILAPADGFVSIGSLKAGQKVAAGQQLLTIAARTRTPEPQRAEPPLSYFEAEVKSLEYQAGFESTYLNLQTNADRDAAALKRLEEAVLELNRSMRGASADLVQARAALDRLRKAVASARAARSGSPVQPEPQTPWWAADPQDPAAKAIEISARIQLDGTAREVSVVRSGDPSLNQSAIEAVQSWRFPLMSGGRVTYAIDVLVDPTKLARR
jgi:GWxTD domain-containing protein